MGEWDAKINDECFVSLSRYESIKQCHDEILEEYKATDEENDRLKQRIEELEKEREKWKYAHKMCAEEQDKLRLTYVETLKELKEEKQKVEELKREKTNLEYSNIKLEQRCEELEYIGSTGEVETIKPVPCKCKEYYDALRFCVDAMSPMIDLLLALDHNQELPEEIDGSYIQNLIEANQKAVPLAKKDTNTSKCALCGEPMPEGEEMFKYHGYSGRCPKKHGKEQ